MNKLVKRFATRLPKAMANPKMPLNYGRAKRAMAACERIDECKEWSDVAAAVASYAAQAKDRELFDSATRIQCRAEEQLGVLLSSYPVLKGIYDRESKRILANPASRRAVAERNGVTGRLYSRATRISRIPKSERDRLIEANPPITASALADRAPPAQYRPNHAGIGGDPSGGKIGEFIRWIQDKNAGIIARDMSERDARYIRPRITQLIEWLDEFERCLRPGQEAARAI